MIEAVQQFMEDHEALLWWIAAGSAAMLVLSLLSLPVAAVLMPRDFLARELDGGGRPPRAADTRHPALRIALRVLKNVAGVFLAIMGVAMLVLPGQGVLTLAFALLLLDIPGKHKVVRRFLGSRRVLKLLNGMRRRFNREPLEAPQVTRRKGR